MENSIRILTYHNVPNNGAVLQNYSLQQGLRKVFPQYDIATLDYIPREIRLAELLKLIKIYRKSPFFNLRRSFVFWKFIYLQRNLSLDKRLPLIKSYDNLVRSLSKRSYKALIVGSDNIWKITDKKWNPPFPNIYWLPKEISCRKYTFAASAYSSDPHIIDKKKDYIKEVLENFRLISARDTFTYNLAKDMQKKTPVFKTPDPTFMMDIPSTNVKEKLQRKGINLDKPSVAILLYKDDQFSRNICTFFRKKGFQIIALSMYNANADYNLGHILDPLEWADVFKYFKFVLTDRFHGTIFSLKNHTPFISIEPKELNNYKDESKIYSLLRDFNMEENHLDIYSEDFTEDIFESRYDTVLKNFNISKVDENLSKMKDVCFDYLNKIKEDVDK